MNRKEEEEKRGGESREGMKEIPALIYASFWGGWVIFSFKMTRLFLLSLRKDIMLFTNLNLVQLVLRSTGKNIYREEKC